MHLKALSILNFKNYFEAKIELSPRINCFVGNNGGGKTNLLDAIYYLSFCKSFFNPIDSQNIKFDEGFFVIEGVYNDNNEEFSLYCGVKRNQKKVFKKNKKIYEKLSDHIGIVPLIMISPDDILLIISGSEFRRKFIDGIIAQKNKTYLNNLIQYNNVLAQRNKWLKSLNTSTVDNTLLEIYNEQLVQFGNYIHEERKMFIKDFIEVFQKYYEYISEANEKVDLIYDSHLNNSDFSNLLKDSFQKDRILQYTSVGVHKDDVRFIIKDNPLKKFGSQGQQKTYLIALKLAQFEWLKSQLNITPILLLDDIYDKLDKIRTEKLIDLIEKDTFGQVFITDTNPIRIPELLNEKNIENRVFYIDKGNIQNEK